MDIEKLTKHQIVLLTLLVSFMTSIATGIVTVALMDQAPPEVQRTINQIVERTVEQVVPSVAPAAATAASTTTQIVTKETTVVVKDDDAVASAIAGAQAGMVRIVSSNDKDTLLSRGVAIAPGVVISDLGTLEPMGTLSFMAYLPDGTLVPAKMRQPSATSTLAILDLTLATSSGLNLIPLADPSKLKLGQTVIRIGGNGGDTVGTGVIAKLPQTMSSAHRDLIESSVVSNTPGSVLLDLFGEVVGITTQDSAQVGTDFYTLASTAVR